VKWSACYIVRFDLELFKSRQAIESLIAGKVDVVRTGALTFSQARRRNDGLTPLLAVNVTKDAVIFVRAGLGVTNLAQLRGHSFAFGDTSATLSLRAKVLLARAGVHAQDLSRFAHLNSQAPQNDADPANFDVESRQGLSSHSEAIRAVLAGEYDAAVSRVRHIQQYVNHELIPLHFFESDPNLWVARKGLPLEHAAALRAAALSLRPDEIQALEGAWRSGFTEVSQPRLRELEAMQQLAETLFHRSQPTPAASKEIAP
jgi:ABC-type phosphate/phosphonate transport system substrate-binding protein